MKAIEINGTDYSFPEGVEDLEGFISYLEQYSHRFIRLKEWKFDRSISPYYVETDYEWVWRNISCLDIMKEVELTLMSNEEYEARLREVVAEKCIHCVHNDEGEEDWVSYRDTMRLDGHCWRFEEKNDQKS